MKFLLKFCLGFNLLSLVSVSVWAQDDDIYEYTSEFVWGINKNTNGGLIGGLIFRHSKLIDEDVFRTIGWELMNVKHPQEYRFNSFTGNSFIWAKEHYLYSIRFQYGRNWVIFKKAPQQGVQIDVNIAGGPTLGIEAPYYIEIQTGPSSREKVAFDPKKHGNSFNTIIGTGGLFQGLGESDLELGLNFKTGLSFEFGTFKSNVTGFEVGFQLEAFPRKIILVPFADNRSFYSSVFLTLFYGSRK